MSIDQVWITQSTWDPDIKYQSPKIYKISKPELEELKKQLGVFLAKGWIKESLSPFAAPVLFARKANGGLRLCIDYRNLNKYTKKVNYPLPHIGVLLDTIAGAKVYTTLDLAQGYHHLRIKEDDQHKTAFMTQYIWSMAVDSHAFWFDLCSLFFSTTIK